MYFLLLLILPGVRLQEPSSSSFFQSPHQLPFNAVQFLQHKELTRKGPILFPNDAPPPPPTPLIVTSRPLSESIARSELNPNNSIAEQSQYNQVTLRPNFLARGKNYEPYSYSLSTVAPVYDYDSAKIIQNRKEKFFKDYEKFMKYLHPRKQTRRKRSADLTLVQQSKRRRFNQRRLMEFFKPRKPDSNGSDILVQTLQRRRFDKPKSSTIEDKNKEKDKQNNAIQAAPVNSRKSQYTTTDYYYEDEFNEEDNNFDFDFKKLYTGKKQQHLESNSSEYLEYYPDSRKVRRRQFARLANNEEFLIRPLQSLHKKSNGYAWHRLSDHEKNIPNSDEESDDIVEILGFSTTRRSVMKSVRNFGNDVNSVDMYNRNFENDGGQRKTLSNVRRRIKPQLRVVKPLFVQRQQDTAPKVEHYKYKNSPDYYQSNNKADEQDYSHENNHGDNYAFSYTVKDQKTGDDFSHSQKSTGSATNGEYRVRLPDGRMQIVSYTADENGYKADVRYDEHHNQDNSIDYYEKDKDIGNNYRANHKGFAHNHDYIENEEFLHPQQTPAPYKDNVPDYEPKHVDNLNEYGNKNNNNFLLYNVYPTKSVIVDTTANINDRTLSELSDNNNDYLEQYNTHLGHDKVERAKDDYTFSDEVDYPKDVLDYSSELNHAYQPHKSKFSSLLLRRGEINNQNSQGAGQVRPSYEELKPLFVTNANSRRNAAIPVSTVRPVYAVTPADVVNITPKKPLYNLYTNIKNIVTPTPYTFSTPSPSTPRSYLVSTIANLKHQIGLANKPVLSQHYIDKINKYLSVQ